MGLTVKGKGGKTRYIPVVQKELKEILVNTKGYLFPSTNRPYLSSHHCSKQIAKYLPKGYTAHCLRHRFATIVYKNTNNLLAVSTLLGHSRPETTQRYVKLCDKTLIDVVESARVA